MTGHEALIAAITIACETAIILAARTHFHTPPADANDQEQKEEQAAELRAQAVDDAIATDDNCRLLVALGLIPDPQLVDLPRRDAAELQMLIYPSDILAGGAR